jgi:hypothetical protein
MRRSLVIFVKTMRSLHIASYETHQRSQEISIVTPKRLLQQYLPKPEVVPLSITSSACVGHRLRGVIVEIAYELHQRKWAVPFRRRPIVSERNPFIPTAGKVLSYSPRQPALQRERPPCGTRTVVFDTSDAALAAVTVGHRCAAKAKSTTGGVTNSLLMIIRSRRIKDRCDGNKRRPSFRRPAGRAQPFRPRLPRRRYQRNYLVLARRSYRVR